MTNNLACISTKYQKHLTIIAEVNTANIQICIREQICNWFSLRYKTEKMSQLQNMTAHKKHMNLAIHNANVAHCQKISKKWLSCANVNTLWV